MALHQVIGKADRLFVAGNIIFPVIVLLLSCDQNGAVLLYVYT